MRTVDSSHPLHGLRCEIPHLIPAINRWATIIRPLRGLRRHLFHAKQPKYYNY